MNNKERRGHLRYKDPESGTLRLSIQGGESDRPFTALMLNESSTGLACVYVGSTIEPGSALLWQETEEIRTPCTVVRCERLYDGVNLLALSIAG